MKRIITSIALAFTISTQFLFGNMISYNKGYIIYQYTDDKNDVIYKFGVHKFSKIKYIQNLRSNVSNYVDYKQAQGWTWEFVEEFQHAYQKIMNAFDDPRDPYRFHTDDFGVIIDKKGEISNQDDDDYWYDKKGNRITGAEYRKMNDNKKKKYKAFHANQEVARYFQIIGEAIVKRMQD